MIAQPFAMFMALLSGRFADAAGLRTSRTPRRLEDGLLNEGRGCWGHCGGAPGDCAYCGTGQCCRAQDYRNRVPGCEGAERVLGDACGAWRGGGFPDVMNAGLPCFGPCGRESGDCDYCGIAGQCCRRIDGKKCVPGCELAFTEAWLDGGPGSQCGEFRDPSAAHCGGAPPPPAPTTPAPAKYPTGKPTVRPTEAGLLNEGRGCWGHCDRTAGDCAYCGAGQCCRAIDYRNQVEGCERAENVMGAKCGAWRGEFPDVMNVGLSCFGHCGNEPGDCDFCGIAGQCCRRVDGEQCVPGCELAFTDAWLDGGHGSQCGEFRDPSAAHCTGVPPPAAPTTLAPAPVSSDPPTNKQPTGSPTVRPTFTEWPTNKPTNRPTDAPTKMPTNEPTDAPTTRQPTNDPTSEPTRRKSSENPTSAPATKQPTKGPTSEPTSSPSRNPTPFPTTATPTSGPTQRPTFDEGHSPKKGIGMWIPQSCHALDDYDGVSWWYEWGDSAFRRGICDDPAAATTVAHNSGKEFVPMLWSHEVPSRPFSEEFTANLENAQFLMTFNEPERTDQANISPFHGAQLWPQVVSIANEYNLQLVAPCGTIDHGFTWYEEWLLSCEELYGVGCEYDFTCLHAYYQPLPCYGIPGWACVSGVMGKINRWKNQFGKATWVTEFACNPWVADCDAQKQQELMQQWVPRLESSDSVFRYAWFEAYGSDFGEANTNEVIFEHTPKKACPNKAWLAGVGPDPSWQVTAGSIKECLAKADQNTECHAPVVIHLDKDNCYCSTDTCPSLEFHWEGMHTWREVGERGISRLTDLGLFYLNVRTSEPTSSPSRNPTPYPTTATPNSGPTQRPTGPSPKKGIGMGVPQSCNALDDYEGVSWWYEWGESAFRRGICDDPAAATTAARDSGKDFVPMLWSHVPSQPFSEEFTANLENAQFLMTFHEPERRNEANISPFHAAQLWPQVVSIANEYSLQLVAPCGNIDHGFTWYQEWLLSCEELYGVGCEYDFTCLHAYYQPQPCNGVPGWACVSGVMNKIDKWKDQFGKATWVAEFVCNPWVVDCDAQKQHDLMQQLVPQLESSDSVFRYAWFEAYGSDFGEANTNEMIFEHTPKKACPNLAWLAGVGPDPSWQVTAGSIKECLAKADQNAACHTPAVISMDKDNCYCSTDACPSLVFYWEGMNTWREVGERGSSQLSDLGLFYQNVGENL